MRIKKEPTKRHATRETTREEAKYRERLIAARRSANLPRKEFAEKIGAKYLTLKAWELGRFRTPLVAVIAAEYWCELNALRHMIGNMLDGRGTGGGTRKR